MKVIIISRQGAKTAKVFLGELSVFARIVFEVWLIRKDVSHSKIASCPLISILPPGTRHVK